MAKTSKPPRLYVHNRQATSCNISISGDGRCLVSQPRDLQVRWPSSALLDDSMDIDIAPQEIAEPQESQTDDSQLEPQAGLEGIHVVTLGRTKRYENSDDPMRTWIRHRDDYLAEVLHLEGRGPSHSNICMLCDAEADFFFCCRDCCASDVLCQQCIVSRHLRSPLHAVEFWTGTYFKRNNLHELGLVVQLGHRPSILCSLHDEPHSITVLHTNRVHTMKVTFCACSGVPEHKQFLQFGWWPATPLELQSCTTMHLLHLFHTLNLQGKVTAYDFYKSLELMMDNMGLLKLPDRLPAFMLMVRQWHHIKMAKCVGHSYDSGSISSTNPGGLAVQCRACPHPGINLPDGWEDSSSADRWLYTLFVSHDANFCLSNHVHARDQRDLWLAPSMAYFVHNEQYADFIKNFVNQEEICTCVGFAVLMNALNRKAKGL
ncbi:hypothetical protein SCP_0206920 [Sparassis crispa]|uniref:CxC2-like cysteine cluster KDZ transposase-associated domain-containing protein n=1 Tax=Sparassis crispa TaxID=139825 RepID=A0A401GBF9_9APHY|nr:hypothetical protein SCP_0206920 [Sparassis crispa]GBE79492.1 hypothetical protein SCP_0206920 [Sparassis crispa]